MNVLLCEWFMIEHSKGVLVSRPMIILKAKVLYAKSGICGGGSVKW